MANSETTKLENLRERLKGFWGSQKEIVERTGYHRQYVRMVLLGERYNEQIVETAYEVLLEYEAAASSHRRRVHELQRQVRELAES